MRTALAAALILAAGIATAQDKPAAPPKAAPATPAAPATEKPVQPAAEPDAIKVQHILISFAGTPRTTATRTKEEAEKLAQDLLARVKKGESFDELMKQYSNDPGPGVYGMVNNGVASRQGYFPRSGMVPAFGDTGFKLKVGEVAMADYDAQKSPFGWHIIKRVE